MKHLTHRRSYRTGGMLWSVADFAADDDNESARIADTAAALIDSCGFGLLQSDEGTFRMTIAGDVLQVVHVEAITASGMLVAQHPQYSPPLTLQLPWVPDWSDIYLIAVNERQPWGGNGDTSGSLRPKYAVPLYRLEVKSKAESFPAQYRDALKIGEVRLEHDGFRLSNYIPPCRHIGAHALLWDKLRTFQKIWADLQEWTPYIVAHNTGAAQLSGNAVLAQLARTVGACLWKKGPAVQALDARSHLRDLFHYLAALASLFQFELEINLLHQRRNELLSLFLEVSPASADLQFRQGKFLEAIQTMARARYDHLQILDAVAQMDAFLDHVRPVWQGLAEGPVDGRRRAGPNTY